MRIISGAFRGRSIKSISGPGYRPATSKVRQALFSILESRGVFWPESRVLDLFAGSGSLGLEALSRGARLVWFVEKNKKAVQVIRDNLRALAVSPQSTKVWTRDVAGFFKIGHQVSFDLAFVDPPYKKALIWPVLQEITPVMEPGGHVVVEVESGLDLEQHDFPGLDWLLLKRYGQTRICIWMVRDKK